MAMRTLAWSHGLFAVESLGGMVGRGSFLLPDGRQVSPFYVAPWWDEARDDLDAMTAGLRGEWPCVPFGYPVPEAEVAPRWRAASDDTEVVPFPHGHAAHHHWEFLSAPGADEVAMRIRYPDEDDVAELRRVLRPVADAPAIDFELTVTARRDTSQPVALHGCFALPAGPGQATLVPGGFGWGASFPAVIARGATLFATDAEFTDLARAPGIDGRAVDATLLPLDRPVEDLVQLNGADGSFGLLDHAAGYRLEIAWDASILPSVILWYSNRGRGFAPWNGRNLCIGIEPCCTAYGLAPGVSTGANPINAKGIPTAVRLAAGEPLTIRYRIAVAAL